jgi:hypothetical protein
MSVLSSMIAGLTPKSNRVMMVSKTTRAAAPANQAFHPLKTELRSFFLFMSKTWSRGYGIQQNMGPQCQVDNCKTRDVLTSSLLFRVFSIPHLVSERATSLPSDACKVSTG